jgi:hypothetical protein
MRFSIAGEADTFAVLGNGRLPILDRDHADAVEPRPKAIPQG